MSLSISILKVCPLQLDLIVEFQSMSGHEDGGLRSCVEDTTQSRLLERLNAGENLIVAEGYLFEVERLGYCKAGSFVPEVVLDNPELLKNIHRQYVNAGSDVVLAYTYYGHRAKLRLIGREDELEPLNIKALQIAREVADETGTLMAGNLCNSTIYRKDDPESIETCRKMNKENVEWAVRGGADFILGETYQEFGEAMLALEAIKEHGNGIPAVITVAPQMTNVLADGVPIDEACRKLGGGWGSCGGSELLQGTDHNTRATQTGQTGMQETRAFPLELQTCLSTRDEVRYFAEECKKIGVQYVGLCCGNTPNYLRIITEVYGKDCPALKYAPEMHKHFLYGDKTVIHDNDYYTKSMKYNVSGRAEAC
ncbi:hypothetical protein FSP39_015537 [Pinctada imbricata]|uniref:Hcy-binding domain-containing protein n=1 Tax=Pinctada imbricata TaxID=66713 RepID=A0AA88YF81_PINIB|nr:hypothetical protein FSP39_015537 [Pinctada imbricata]